MKYLFGILFLFCLSNLSAQGRLDPASCDCRGRIFLERPGFMSAASPSGPGLVDEIRAESSGAGQVVFEEEHHTAWFEFEAPGDCRLELRIEPERPDDDYDFIIFPFYGETTCDSIRRGSVEPLRSVISRNDPSIGSATGLRSGAGGDMIPQGPGLSFAEALPVKAGRRYLLVVDNVYPDGGGFSLSLSYSDCRIDEPEALPVPDQTHLLIQVLDSLGRELGATITVRQKYSSSPGPDTLLETFASQASTDLPPSSYYMVQVRARGYVAVSDDIRTRSGNDTLRLEFRLDTLKVGQKFRFEKIYFRAGTDQFLPGSKTPLKQIHKLLHDNPTVCVEIQGHINQPYNLISRLSARESQGLSEMRARAVYDYLVRRGIDADRMTYKGYGNSRMIYPYARNEEEMSLNRRVEIVITRINDE